MFDGVSIADALPLLSLAEGEDVQGVGLDVILHGCQCFALNGLSDVGGVYALKPVGRELWIQAAGGKGAADLTLIMLTAIEQQAAAGAFRSVGFQTRRKGLIKKASRAGYLVEGVIMRKVLK